MSIRELRYLIALADCLSFTRAADRCSVTQSTLSIQLRKLEDYLGMRLFERDRSHVALTADGNRVLELARVAVRAADEIVSIGRAKKKNAEQAAQTPRARASEEASAKETLIEEINCQRSPAD